MEQKGTPKCFGSVELWDPKSPECAGGLDPMWVNDNRMSSNYATHVRDRCAWFGECGTKVGVAKMERARELIPASNLTRPPVVTRAEEQERYRQYWAAKAQEAEREKLLKEQKETAPWQPPASHQFSYSMATAQQKLEMERYQKAMEEHQRRMAMTAPMMMPPMMGGYQQMMPVNFTMPQYLSAAEPMYEGRSFWEMLGVTILRSVFKSAGHSVAHVFDSVPWGMPPALPPTKPQ